MAGTAPGPKSREDRSDSLYRQAEVRQRMTVAKPKDNDPIINCANVQVSDRQWLFAPLTQIPGLHSPISFCCLTITFCCLTITFSCLTISYMSRLKPPGETLTVTFYISGGLPRFAITVQSVARLCRKTEARGGRV